MNRSRVPAKTPGANYAGALSAVHEKIITDHWDHAILARAKAGFKPDESELYELAQHYCRRFMEFFVSQREGSINQGITIEMTRRMRQKLGLAYLFDHKIKLNSIYFINEPSLLPYILFHEMTHLWLYDCWYDPRHTWRFYKKMKEFELTGLPVDPQVHIHTRLIPEGQFIYACPNCENRWYLRDKLAYAIYCGFCYEHQGIEFYAGLVDSVNSDQRTLKKCG